MATHLLSLLPIITNLDWRLEQSTLLRTYDTSLPIHSAIDIWMLYYQIKEFRSQCMYAWRPSHREEVGVATAVRLACGQPA